MLILGVMQSSQENQKNMHKWPRLACQRTSLAKRLECIFQSDVDAEYNFANRPVAAIMKSAPWPRKLPVYQTHP